MSDNILKRYDEKRRNYEIGMLWERLVQETVSLNIIKIIIKRRYEGVLNRRINGDGYERVVKDENLKRAGAIWCNNIARPSNVYGENSDMDLFG